jgi:pantoate--beta-alanine ligase
MRVIASVAAMQRLARQWQNAGKPVSFVPTMGFLHAGHLSLMERARQACGLDGVVVVSIYVNPTQFGPGEDFAQYPRDLRRDAALCREAGVDVLFTPADAEMYPPDFSVYVTEERLAKVMEGVTRPQHFRGVTTVVAKLFNAVLPTTVVFGAKDFQQAAIVRRMVRDLNFPVKIIVAPIVREADGLALSSRNKYLSPEERRQAPILFLALQTAQAAVATRPMPRAKLQKKIHRLISSQPSARVDYVEFFDSETLQPVPRVQPGTRMALAVWMGKTRLIDNAKL